MYQCISVVKAKPESVQTIIDAAAKLVEISRPQKGNIYYNLLRSSDDPNTVILIEKWETKEDFLGHVAHADTPGDPVFEFGAIAAPNSAEPPMIFNCEVLV